MLIEYGAWSKVRSLVVNEARIVLKGNGDVNL